MRLVIIALVTLCLLLLTGTLITKPKDPQIPRIEQDFVEAWNGWMLDTKHLSPVSPDYNTQGLESWQRHDLGNKFRKLEYAVKWWAEKERGE